VHKRIKAFLESRGASSLCLSRRCIVATVSAATCDNEVEEGKETGRKTETDRMSHT